MGTTNGLVVFNQQFSDPENIVFQTYTHNPKDKNSLSNNNVDYIYSSRDNEMYVATFGGGLNKVIYPSNSDEKPAFQSFTEETGAPSDIILSIIDDLHGNLWMSSERGIPQIQ